VAKLIDASKLAASSAGAVFDRLLEQDAPAEDVATQLGLVQVSDTGRDRRRHRQAHRREQQVAPGLPRRQAGGVRVADGQRHEERQGPQSQARAGTAAAEARGMSDGNDDDVPDAALAYQTPPVAPGRHAVARRLVSIAGITGLACATAVFAATVVEEQGVRQWRRWETVTLWTCLIAAKVLSVAALVSGVALARRVADGDGHGDDGGKPLLGIAAGAGGVIVLVAWAVWVGR
jgi:hypothetical protein